MIWSPLGAHDSALRCGARFCADHASVDTEICKLQICHNRLKPICSLKIYYVHFCTSLEYRTNYSENLKSATILNQFL